MEIRQYYTYFGNVSITNNEFVWSWTDCFSRMERCRRIIANWKSDYTIPGHKCKEKEEGSQVVIVEDWKNQHTTGKR